MSLPKEFLSKVSTSFAENLSEWSTLPGNVRGSVWALLAAGVSVVQMTLVKLAGETLHLTEIIFCRQMIMLVFILPIIMRNFPEAFKTSYPFLHFVRICGALVAITMGFTAVIHLPLADATTIGFAKSFFVTIFAILILGETVGPRRWGAVIVGFIGVMIVMQPGDGGESFGIYGAMALAGAAGAGLVMVIIRKISQKDKPVTFMAYQAFGVGGCMLGPAIYYWQAPTFVEWGILIAIGAVSVVVQTCNVLAYRAGEASAITPIDYTRLIYALFVGFLLFGDWPNTTVFIGAALIVSASLYTVHREARIARELGLSQGDADNS